MTTRTASRIALQRHRRPAIRHGVVLAVLALLLRLALPTPPTPVPVEARDFAAFGEHALCLAAPSRTDDAPTSRDGPPSPKGDHTEHDHSLCCLWHVGAGAAAPQLEPAVRIVFIEASPPVAAATGFHPASLTGPNNARAPPDRA